MLRTDTWALKDRGRIHELETGYTAQDTQRCPELPMGRQFDRKHANKKEREDTFVS